MGRKEGFYFYVVLSVLSEFLLACVLFIKLSFKKERRALKLTKVIRAREDF